MIFERTFVLVGHCWADRSALKSTIARTVPDATIVRANSTAALDKVLTVDREGAVLMVNRVLDGRFATDSGVELIRQLARGDAAPAMLLISDYPEAQTEAEVAGALRGFGKSQLHEAQTADKITGSAR